MPIPKDMTKGTIFTTKNYGKLYIDEYVHTLKVQVIFCKTKYACYARACNIRNGAVRDPYKPFLAKVGYTGEGKYKNTRHGVYKRAYSVWSGMIRRCYSEESLKRQPSYRYCTVCPEWHNFQNFAYWFENNYHTGAHLDKDILIDGNTEYSPKTCQFVTQKENSQKAKARYFDILSPTGDKHRIYNLEAFCRKHGLHSASLRKVRAGQRKHSQGWKLLSYGSQSAGPATK